MTKTNMLYIIILLSDDISISANITSGGSSIVTKFEPYKHMTGFDGHRGLSLFFLSFCISILILLVGVLFCALVPMLDIGTIKNKAKISRCLMII